MYKVSFLIPAYNAENCIAQCLDHILACSLSPEEYQIIVWNDGSTDGTDMVMQEYIRKYTNIIYKKGENQGVAGVRNYLFDMAEGEYIWQCDSDDYINTETIPYIVNYAIRKKLDVLTFDYFQIDDKGGIRTKTTQFHKTIDVCYLWNRLFRNSFVKENHISFKNDLILGDDALFTITAIDKAKTHKHIHKLGYYYKYNSSSLTRDPKKFHKGMYSMYRLMDYFQIELDNTSKDKNYWIEQIYLDALMLLRFSKQLPEAERKSLESGVNNKLMSIIETHNGTCNTNRLKHILDDKGKEIRKLYKIIRFKSIFSFLYRTIFY